MKLLAVVCGVCAALVIMVQAGLAAAPFTPGMAEEAVAPRSDLAQKTAVTMPEVMRAAAARPAFAAGGRRVRVKRFAISGNTVFSEDELRAVIRDKEGSDLTLAEIYAQANRLTAFYRQHGYTLATVTVPEQRMKSGVLKLLVVEGLVGKLVVSGNAGYSDGFITRRLTGLAPGSAVRFDELESGLLLLNDLPGLTVHSVLAPGDEPGTTDINLDVKEKPFSAAVSVDNSGRKFVGQWRFGADFIFNNPLRTGDVLSMSYTHAQGDMFRQWRGSYGLPLFTPRDRLDVSYSRTEYYVGKEFDDLDLDGTSETSFIKYSHIFMRTLKNSVYAELAFFHLRGKADMMDIDITNDNVNYLDLGINYTTRSGRGGYGNVAAHIASNFKGDSGDDQGYTRFQFNGDFEQFFSRAISAFVRGELVLSSDSLPDLNKYSIGGIRSVRGFVSAARRGDQGWMGSVELRYLQHVSHADLRWSCFVDSGKVDNKGTLLTGGNDSLTSVGIGLHAVVAGNYIFDVQWAHPVDGNDAGDDLTAPLWFIFSALY